jgi:hypothetical protein
VTGLDVETLLQTAIVLACLWLLASDEARRPARERYRGEP